MEKLIRQSKVLVQKTMVEHIRQLRERIDWSWRLNGIKGARGVGKTTLLLQQLKLSDAKQEHSIYLPLDDLHFLTHTLRDTIEDLAARGYQNVYLYEVHKYNTSSSILLKGTSSSTAKRSSKWEGKTKKPGR